MKYEVDEDKLWFCERKGYPDCYLEWNGRREEVKDEEL